MRRFLPLLLALLSSSIAFSQYDLVVAKDGSGNHTTVQAAINAAPTGLTAPYRILIKNGIYKEKITVPSNKPFIQLIGESVANVVLTYDDYSGKPMPGGGTYGTSTSASVTINAADFSAMNITFENTTGEQPQALAINVNADRAAFKNCRFHGGQDTVLANGNGNRQYFLNCYIDGQIDFIFGNSIAVFDSCVIYAKTRYSGTGNSYVTAANTQSGQAYGYVFRDCIMPANRGVTNYWLGRPWQNDASTADAAKAHNKTVFLNTIMTNNINPDGWAVWNAGTNTSLITYAEYKSKRYNGTLVDVSQRVSWSQQLSDAQAAAYYVNSNLFGTWDPCTAFINSCSYEPRPIVVSNFGSIKYPSNLTDTIRWNISWAMNDIKYELYRSSDSATFSKIYEVTATNDSLINFEYVDAIPAPGTKYHYYLIASKAGYTSDTSETITLSSVPTIVVSGSTGDFLQGVGLPSAAQAYNVSGHNLFTGITIQAPANYEISSDGGTTWNSTTPIVLPATNGIVSNTAISVRLNAASAGTYTGVIAHTSTGANQVDVAVNGNTQADPLAVSGTLMYFPLNLNNQDTAALRAAGVMASTPTLNRLAVSNGTTVPAVPAYSPTHGMAYGSTSNGDGSWGTAAGGPGGNLNRTYYIQYTITADAGYSVRVDSIILKHAFHNTSSNTKLAVVYSKSGFASDSANVTGGIGADGAALSSSANGGFTTPIAIGNQTAGTTNNYRLAFDGASGVTLAAGETLTVRLYNSCGSTSTGRYGKMKDVEFKGLATGATLPVSFEMLNAYKKQNTVKVEWTTGVEVNIARYEVERTTDAGYKVVATVAAKAAGYNSYEATDNSPEEGNNYYRIKAIEKDGKISYSAVATVNFTPNKRDLIISPNPVVGGQVNVSLTNAVKGTYKLTLLNATGVQVVSRTINHNGGSSVYPLNVGSLAKGVYLLQVASGSDQISKSILIQ